MAGKIAFQKRASNQANLRRLLNVLQTAIRIGTIHKVHPRRILEGPEGEWRHSSTLSLTLMIDVARGQSHAPAASTPRERPGTRCIGALWAPGPFWRAAQNLSLKLLRYPQSRQVCGTLKVRSSANRRNCLCLSNFRWFSRAGKDTYCIYLFLEHLYEHSVLKRKERRSERHV